MKVKRTHAAQQFQGIQIPVNCEGCDLLCTFDQCWTKPILIDHWHTKALHQRARVLAKALLPRDECIPMVQILLLSLLQTFGESHVVMRPQQKTRALSL